jgi:hypothetical protein
MRMEMQFAIIEVICVLVHKMHNGAIEYVVGGRCFIDIGLKSLDNSKTNGKAKNKNSEKIGQGI